MIFTLKGWNCIHQTTLDYTTLNKIISSQTSTMYVEQEVGKFDHQTMFVSFDIDATLTRITYDPYMNTFFHSSTKGIEYYLHKLDIPIYFLWCIQQDFHMHENHL